MTHHTLLGRFRAEFLKNLPSRGTHTTNMVGFGKIRGRYVSIDRRRQHRSAFVFTYIYLPRCRQESAEKIARGGCVWHILRVIIRYDNPLAGTLLIVLKGNTHTLWRVFVTHPLGRTFGDESLRN